MAYNITDDELLKLMISDPSWCMFYQREKVKQLLPTLAKAHILVTTIEEQIKEKVEATRVKKTSFDIVEKRVTELEAAELLFSGEYDQLTAKEFRERFPLKEWEEGSKDA